MGAGYAQVGLLLLLTVVGLPLFFFALMAALDRFERAISARPGVAAHSTPEPLAEPEPQAIGSVVSLPVTPAPLATSPLAGAASAAVAAAGKSAAAI